LKSELCCGRTIKGRSYGVELRLGRTSGRVAVFTLTKHRVSARPFNRKKALHIIDSSNQETVEVNEILW